MNNALPLLVLSSALAGCMATSNIAPSESAAIASNETIVIIGVSPRYRVAFRRGTPREGSWLADRSATAIAVANVYPENGYVVLKLAASGQMTYGLTQILPEGIGGTGTPIFQPCGEQKLMTFDAPGGKAIYLGDLEYSREKGKMSMRYVQDFDRARAFVVASYPALTNKLEAKDPQFLSISGAPCGSSGISVPMTIMIPAPRRN